MFCNQCEQTARGTGCTTVGVCGKKEDVATLQDLLCNALRGLASSDEALGLNDWVGLALECGKVNLRAMELLDAANTGTCGHPVPTEVQVLVDTFGLTPIGDSAEADLATMLGSAA